MGIFNFINPLKLLDLTTFSISKKLAVIQHWMPWLIFIGVIVAIEKGIPVLMSTVYISMLFGILNSFHLINSIQGTSISEWLKISNFNHQDTYAGSKLTKFWSKAPKYPAYVPWNDGSNAILYPYGI